MSAGELSELEFGRLAELAFRLVAWRSRRRRTGPADRAAAVVDVLGHLVADRAERGGYPFRAPGVGSAVALEAAQVPGAWRVGWPYSGAGGVRSRSARERLPVAGNSESKALGIDGLAQAANSSVDK